MHEKELMKALFIQFYIPFQDMIITELFNFI